MADTWYIDYSAAALSGTTIANAVVGPKGERASGAIRYIDDITNPSLVRKKHVTKAEYNSLVAAGLNMDAMFMEVATTDPNGGYAQGQAYARRALAGANYLGFTGKILFCCDGWMNSVGVTVAEWQSYLDGARSILGDRAGGYGFSDAADAARGHVTSFVQCGARSAVRAWVNGWQDNNVQPFVGGIQTDRILILNRFSGISSGGGGSTPAGPTITTTTGDDDVAQIFDYPACAPGETRTHTFVLPVGSVSQVTKNAWLSFKCSGGAAEKVRLMAIRSGVAPNQTYPIDKTWTNVANDTQRPYIAVGPGTKGTATADADGTDQFVAYITSQKPYSLCIETAAK